MAATPFAFGQNDLPSQTAREAGTLSPSMKSFRRRRLLAMVAAVVLGSAGVLATAARAEPTYAPAAAVPNQPMGQAK